MAHSFEDLSGLAAAGTMVGVHCHQSLAGAEETRVGIRQRGGQGVRLCADLSFSQKTFGAVCYVVSGTLV